MLLLLLLLLSDRDRCLSEFVCFQAACRTAVHVRAALSVARVQYLMLHQAFQEPAQVSVSLSCSW